MSFVKKIWKDRISQFPNRRTINDGYVTKQVTVGRDEGAVTEEGTPFDATEMNDLENRIYAAIEQGGGGGGSTGTYDYTELFNKPRINNHELNGNQSATDLGIASNATELPIESGSATNTKAYVDNIAPQVYRVVGKILDSRGGTIEGAGTAIVTLSNGIARIDFALDIETADTASHNYWGINRDLLTSFVGKIITPSFGGVFTYYKPDGTINADRMGYGGAFTLAEEYWKPARIYRITANPSTYGTGSWADNLFPVGSRMVGTCWGTYT